MLKKVITDPDAIEDVLSRGVEELVKEEHLRERLLSGEILRIKFGIDPTSPHIHFGHTVPLRKLRQFQDLGHQAVLIIGDATAMIGDPTGRSESRKILTKEEIEENQKTYIEQAGKVIDLERAEIHHNGEWFGPMSAADFLGLTSLVTVQQMMQREDFRKRVDDPTSPLKAIEITYPIMQGYDSVMVRADVEIGGADQLLNLYMGRRLQRKFGQPEQDLLTVSLIEGLDGGRKMSKSFGNAIALEDPPEEIFAKTMSIPDALMVSYFTLLTEWPTQKIEAAVQAMETGKENPRDVKAKLAWELTRIVWGTEKADEAQMAFDKLFRAREVPEDIPVKMRSHQPHALVDVLVESGLVSSKTEARRQIEQGGIKVGDAVVKDVKATIVPTKEGIVIQKGKRHFVKIVAL